jgi:hypothetical protein
MQRAGSHLLVAGLIKNGWLGHMMRGLGVLGDALGFLPGNLGFRIRGKRVLLILAVPTVAAAKKRPKRRAEQCMTLLEIMYERVCGFKVCVETGKRADCMQGKVFFQKSPGTQECVQCWAVSSCLTPQQALF